jgi:hypothetical protein
MDILTVAGDMLWAVALAIMVGVSRHAAKRIAPETRVPLAGLRVSRNVGLWTVPVVAFLLSLWLAYSIRTNPGEGDMALIHFGARATTASLAALLHLRWVKAALQALEKEGALKP